MKDKRKIEQEFLKQLENLKKHNKFYFTDDSPRISDYEYDKLRIRITAIESRFPNLKEEDGPTTSVGATADIGFSKIVHEKSMCHFC